MTLSLIVFIDPNIAFFRLWTIPNKFVWMQLSPKKSFSLCIFYYIMRGKNDFAETRI